MGSREGKVTVLLCQDQMSLSIDLNTNPEGSISPSGVWWGWTWWLEERLYGYGGLYLDALLGSLKTI